MSNNNIKPSRGRPRKFDEAKVLQLATQAFLEDGYEAASYEKIAAAMGLSKPSLYNAFGDKLSLFEQVLEGYSAQAQAFILGSFENADTLKAATEKMLISAAVFYSKPNDLSLGCLLIGTALPATSQNDSIREILTNFTQSVERSLEDIISQKYAGDSKTIAKSPRALALQVTSLIYALAVRARTGLTRQQLTQYAKELAATM